MSFNVIVTNVTLISYFPSNGLGRVNRNQLISVRISINHCTDSNVLTDICSRIFGIHLICRNTRPNGFNCYVSCTEFNYRITISNVVSCLPIIPDYSSIFCSHIAVSVNSNIRLFRLGINTHGNEGHGNKRKDFLHNRFVFIC